MRYFDSLLLLCTGLTRWAVEYQLFLIYKFDIVAVLYLCRWTCGAMCDYLVVLAGYRGKVDLHKQYSWVFYLTTLKDRASPMILNMSKRDPQESARQGVMVEEHKAQ